MVRCQTSHLPDDFVWGVATSAYQIEGGFDRDGRGPSIWDAFTRQEGRVANGDTGDVACDHRTRWADDLDLIGSLKVPAYRLSLSWTRLQPEGRGPLSSSAVRWYRQLLSGMRERGIEPWVTLYHWDLPQRLELQGGWPDREAALRFGDYAATVVDTFRDLVSNWVTINEPWCASFLGYGYGVHAPGRTDVSDAVAAAHHLNLAHGLATQAVVAVDPSAQVGVTNIVADLVPQDSARDAAAVARLDTVNHKLFLAPVYLGDYSSETYDLLDPFGLESHIRGGDLDTISTPTTFAGVNHYQRVIVTDDPSVELTGASETPDGPPFTSFGWSITPTALTSVLESVHTSYTDLPLYITENGMSHDDVIAPDGTVHDAERVAYLDAYIDAVDVAARRGVPVAGYFAWSLLDNFEWAEGYGKRFGLVHVDFETQVRTPKHSAHHYADIVAAHQHRRSTRGVVEPARAGI